MVPAAKDRLATRIVLALAFLAFTCVFPYLHAVNNPNENVRTYMTMAMVEEHTFRIDSMVARHGWVNDMAKAPDPKTGESHVYSVKAPAISYAGAPFYWAFTKIAPKLGHPVPTVSSTSAEKEWWLRASTFVLRLFTVQIPCFLFLVWFERFLRGTTRDAVLRLTAVVAVGLGTNYLAYSLMFASHAPFACAAFGSFAVIVSERARFPGDPKRRRASRAFLAGFLAGLATLLEYHAFPVSGVLALVALATFYRPTRLAAFGAGALLNAGALMFFQWRAFGSPLTPGHRMSENPAFAALLNQGLFGIGKPSFDVFVDISLSHAFGFFGTSPYMWLGFLAIPFGVLVARRGARFQAEHRAFATLGWLCLMLGLWVTVSAAINWRGGWTIGPRYLGAAPPFFAFGAVCGLEAFARGSRVRRSVARGLAGGLAIASVIQIGLVGLLYNSIPESVTRPLPQVFLPLARAGFVPWHAGELVGLSGPGFWYVVAGGVVLAAVVAALAPARDRIGTYALRVSLVALFCVIGLRPAFRDPEPREEGDGGVEAKRLLLPMWQPVGRDRITTLTRAAESGRPCLWWQVADLERAVGRTADADRDEKRAGKPRSECQ